MRENRYPYKNDPNVRGFGQQARQIGANVDLQFDTQEPGVKFTVKLVSLYSTYTTEGHEKNWWRYLETNKVEIRRALARSSRPENKTKQKQGTREAKQTHHKRRLSYCARAKESELCPSRLARAAKI